MRTLSIYLAFVKQQFQALMEYRMDFLLGLLGLLVQQFATFLLMFAVFTQVKAVGTWTFEEMLLLFGWAQLVRGIDHIYNDNIWFIAWYSIREGKFYQYLIRPWNPLSLIVMERISIDGFGELIGSLIIFFYAKHRLGLALGFEGALMMLWFFACGLAIYFAVKLAFAAIAFWTTTSGEIMSFGYEANNFARYPLDLYKNRAVQFFITFVLPFAVVSFFPMLYFLRTEPQLIRYFGFAAFHKWWIPVFTGVVAAAFLGISLLIWRTGIRNFQATGT
jgi:ABC-2 type transport system permease protein